MKRRAKTRAFAELVVAARDEGKLEEAWVRPNNFGFERRDRHHDVLMSLKDVRKMAKHRSQDKCEAWLRTNFWHVASALECLSTHATDERRPTR